LSGKQYKVKSPIVTRRLLIVFTALLLAVLICGGYFAYRTVYDKYLAATPQSEVQSSDVDTNILLLGEDDKNLRISLVKCDVSDGTVSVTSLPSNLMVTYNEMNKTLKGYYSYGGILYLKQVLIDSMGLKIDNYLYIPPESVQGIVDSMGGLEFEVDREMIETDSAGVKKTDLRQGLQTLNGQQVVGYYRYRSWQGNNEALQKKTEMTCAIIKKLLSAEIAQNFEGLYKKYVNTFETDINAQQVASFVSEYDIFIKNKEVTNAIIIEVSEGENVSLSEDGTDALLTTFGK
jgi:LCP family protein required for cell wall assembly